MTYHIHAVAVPETTVEMTRTDKATGETKVIENYEHGQDSVGAALSHLTLTRGERRAAAIKAARDAGQEPPKRRHHARTSDWRAAQELVIANREAAVDERETRVESREAEAILCAAEMIGTGQVEIDESGDAPDLRAVPPENAPEQIPRLPAVLKAAPAARKKAAGLFAPMLARMRRLAKAEAEAPLAREVTELRTAWGTIETVLSRLPRSVRESLGEPHLPTLRTSEERIASRTTLLSTEPCPP